MRTIGIVAHSAEGAALCFIAACREGQKLMGSHMHPEIVVSAIPMGLSMPGWESGDHRLCIGVFRSETTDRFVRASDALRSTGADCAILACTEIPLIISDVNSPLPVLDSTRLLAKYAVREAIAGESVSLVRGWL